MAHLAFLHPALLLTGTTERTLAAARALRERGHRVTVLSRPGSRLGAFEAEGIEVSAAELPTDLLTAPFAALRTARALKELAPDLLFVTHSSLAGLGAFLARRLDRPYLVEIGRALRRRLPRDESRLGAVLLTCRTLEEAAVNHGELRRDLVRVLEHGPRPQPAVAPRERGRDPLCVGFTGTLAPDRGTGVFLEAARLLSLSGRDLAFLFLGEGPEEEGLRRRVRELALAEIVVVTAPAAPRVEDLLALIDVHVSCNLDGVPDWLSHQALALGLPLIASAVSSSFALIRDRESGVLVERGKPMELAREIARLADDPALAGRLGAAARAKALEEDRAGRYETGLVEAVDRALGVAVA